MRECECENKKFFIEHLKEKDCYRKISLNETFWSSIGNF